MAEFSPVAAGAVFDGGTASQSEAEATLSRQLDKSVRRSRAVDTESLCIAAGRACVAVRADLQILRHDGNVLDATCLALAAALAHFRRPDAVVEQASDDGGSRAVGKVRTFDAQEREPVPLALLHRPLCVSFAACDGGDCLLLDPTAAEEQLREAEIVVAVNDQGELCDVTKYGGVAMDETVILECVALAHRRARELGELVARGLKQDSRKRDVGDLIAELRAENDR